jgi:glycosyltransferase involved in cell wall biosynthesis
MKKIIIDARKSGTTSGRYMDKLIEHLAALHPPYKFIILAHEHRLNYLAKVAPKFEIVECPYKEFTTAEQTKLLKQIKSLEPDLVHFPMVQQPIFYRGTVVTTINDLTTARFRNPSKNRLIFTAKQKIYRRVNKIAARKSAAVLTFTEFVKDDIARFARINSRKITVTYLAADPIPDAPEPIAELDGTKFLMYVGRPLPHKNLGRLIQAFQIIKQDHPELKLVLAGKKDALYKRHEKDVEALEIPDVVFTDFVTEGQLRWLYENTAAYVFPSLSEGFGLPGLEAMLEGAPVVSSNATCLPEVYGSAAEYFDPYNSGEIAKAVAKVIDNPKRTDELKKLGAKQAAKYSWTKTAEQTLAVYREVLGDA